MTLHSIAFIPDGNRRYASLHGLRLEKAYQMGLDKSWSVLEWLRDYPSIKFGTFYTLSLENLRRQKNELNLLFHIFEHAIQRAKKESFLAENNIRLTFSGRLELFPKKLQTQMKEIEKSTSDHDGKTVNLAMGYSGQAEIVDAVKKIATDVKNRNLDASSIDERSFHAYLYSDQPDPDLIIRTSGTKRLSGFLTYQSAYSELYFCQRYWPEFTRQDMDDAIQEYETRQRNFGK